jgi:hypothetical protein
MHYHGHRMCFAGKIYTVRSAKKLDRHQGLTVELQGGLGNQLFGWATGFRVAQEQNVSLLLDTSLLIARKYELDSFLIEQKALMRGEESSELFRRPHFFAKRKIKQEKSYRFDPTILNANKGDTLRGYFQSWKYFHDVKPQIVQRLVLKAESETFKEYDSKLKLSDFDSVHIRRGDYKNLQNYHGLTTQRYYDAALGLLKALNPSNKIVVFSDNIKEARNIVPNAHVYIGAEEKLSAAETLILMSKSSNFIGSNSSFSWWASYLNKNNSGIKIFPRPWFQEKSLNTSDLLPHDWLTLGI